MIDMAEVDARFARAVRLAGLYGVPPPTDLNDEQDQSTSDNESAEGEEEMEEGDGCGLGEDGHPMDDLDDDDEAETESLQQQQQQQQEEKAVSIHSSASDSFQSRSRLSHSTSMSSSSPASHLHTDDPQVPSKHHYPQPRSNPSSSFSWLPEGLAFSSPPSRATSQQTPPTPYTRPVPGTTKSHNSQGPRLSRPRTSMPQPDSDDDILLLEEFEAGAVTRLHRTLDDARAREGRRLSASDGGGEEEESWAGLADDGGEDGGDVEPGGEESGTVGLKEGELQEGGDRRGIRRHGNAANEAKEVRRGVIRKIDDDLADVSDLSRTPSPPVPEPSRKKRVREEDEKVAGVEPNTKRTRQSVRLRETPIQPPSHDDAISISIAEVRKGSSTAFSRLIAARLVDQAKLWDQKIPGWDKRKQAYRNIVKCIHQESVGNPSDWHTGPSGTTFDRWACRTCVNTGRICCRSVTAGAILVLPLPPPKRGNSKPDEDGFWVQR